MNFTEPQSIEALFFKKIEKESLTDFITFIAQFNVEHQNFKNYQSLENDNPFIYLIDNNKPIHFRYLLSENNRFPLMQYQNGTCPISNYALQKNNRLDFAIEIFNQYEENYLHNWIIYLKPDFQENEQLKRFALHILNSDKLPRIIQNSKNDDITHVLNSILQSESEYSKSALQKLLKINHTLDALCSFSNIVAISDQAVTQFLEILNPPLSSVIHLINQNNFNAFRIKYDIDADKIFSDELFIESVSKTDTRATHKEAIAKIYFRYMKHEIKARNLCSSKEYLFKDCAEPKVTFLDLKVLLQSLEETLGITKAQDSVKMS